MKLILTLLLLIGSAMLPHAGRAQTPESPSPAAATGDALRVFLDCNSPGCDFDFFRTEIKFVDYVRDRSDADVHVLVTTQGTGGGGREYTLAFLGQRRFAGRNNTLRYTSRQTESEDVIRRGLARTIKAGLVAYAVETPAGARIEIGYAAPTAAAEQAAPEGGTDYTNVRGSFSANRTTEALKVNFGANSFYSENSFNLGDRTVTTLQRSSSVNSLAVRSIGNQWSAGGRASISSSTFENQDLRVRVAPAIEYSFFPYSEATRRQVTLQYTPGINYLDYEAQTIFGKTEEVLVDHRLTLAADIKQPWGSIDMSVEGSQYLHDLSRNRLNLGGGVDLRLFKGLRFRVDGNATRIRDQLFLSGEELTEEQILLRQRALQTGFRYFGSFGLTYTFGSPFNNVVNPRFGGGGGGGMIFFN
jgi:hypothetical protein